MVALKQADIKLVSIAPVRLYEAIIAQVPNIEIETHSQHAVVNERNDQFWFVQPDGSLNKCFSATDKIFIRPVFFTLEKMPWPTGTPADLHGVPCTVANESLLICKDIYDASDILADTLYEWKTPGICQKTSQALTCNKFFDEMIKDANGGFLPWEDILQQFPI